MSAAKAINMVMDNDFLNAATSRCRAVNESSDGGIYAEPLTAILSHGMSRQDLVFAEVEKIARRDFSEIFAHDSPPAGTSFTATTSTWANGSLEIEFGYYGKGPAALPQARFVLVNGIGSGKSPSWEIRTAGGVVLRGRDGAARIFDLVLPLFDPATKTIVGDVAVTPFLPRERGIGGALTRDTRKYEAATAVAEIRMALDWDKAYYVSAEIVRGGERTIPGFGEIGYLEITRINGSRIVYRRGFSDQNWGRVETTTKEERAVLERAVSSFKSISGARTLAAEAKMKGV